MSDLVIVIRYSLGPKWSHLTLRTVLLNEPMLKFQMINLKIYFCYHCSLENPLTNTKDCFLIKNVESLIVPHTPTRPCPLLRPRSCPSWGPRTAPWPAWSCSSGTWTREWWRCGSAGRPRAFGSPRSGGRWPTRRCNSGSLWRSGIEGPAWSKVLESQNDMFLYYHKLFEWHFVKNVI